jgi:hypothetical protein
MLSSKLSLKTEPVKDIKNEISHHSKESPQGPPPSLGSYLYSRHGMPPQSQHISREEELRR